MAKKDVEESEVSSHSGYVHGYGTGEFLNIKDSSPIDPNTGDRRTPANVTITSTPADPQGWGPAKRGKG